MDESPLRPQQDSPSASSTAIKVEDAKILRPDFFQTTKAGGERQRLALACQTCRQKKVKCDGELPKCHRCTDLQLECEYKLTTHRRSRAQGNQARREQNNGHATTKTEGSSPQGLPSGYNDGPVAKRSKTQQTSGFAPMGGLQPPEGIMTDNASSVVRDVPIQAHNMRQGASSAASVSTPNHHVWHLKEEDKYTMHAPDRPNHYEFHPPLPPYKLMIELCQVYFTRIYGQMYAFLHPPSFMRSLLEFPDTINPALLLAIAAVSARCHTPAFNQQLEPERWAAACLNLIFGTGSAVRHELKQAKSSKEMSPYLRRLLSKPSVSCVQALSLISFHYFGEGQSSKAWLLSGVGIRMANQLHLNLEFYGDPIGQPGNHPPGYNVSFRDREIRRRTYWALYIMDRLNSAGERRPFSLRNDEIQIQLPIKQSSFDRDIPGYTSMIGESTDLVPGQDDTSVSMDCVAYMIRMIDIWGEVSCFVQLSASELNWTTGSPLTSLRQKIFSWAESLPAAMQYVSGKPGSQTPAWYIMHTTYFLSLCVIHRFALPKSVHKQYGIDHIPLSYLNMCVKEAIHNAKKVSEIIQIIANDPNISAPFLGFAAFSAATLHAFLGYSVPDMTSTSAAEHRDYVSSTLNFLNRLSKPWKPVSKMHDALVSQIDNRSRSRSGNSILHDTSECASQFTIPDSRPNHFTTQQQIEMNTLGFSNWFDDPLTNPKLISQWGAGAQPISRPAPGFEAGLHGIVSYDSCTGQITNQGGPQADPPQPELPERRTRPPNPSNAPYGEAFPIVNSEDSDDDNVVADLLVSFRQCDSQQNGDGIPPPPSGAKGGNFQGDRVVPQQPLYRTEEFLDQLSNLRETHNQSATIDCLQLMKVGLITAQNWS